MSHYKQILVAVDFSDTSIRALQVARDIGTRLNAKLHIVNFVPMRVMDMGMEGGVDFIEEMHQKELEESREKLKIFIKEHTTDEDEIDQYTQSGEPAAEINTMVELTSAELIVIGTHGRTGLKYLLLGSIAESILKVADVPVLCVRSP